jgi:prepilin peptidase CpaA
MVASNYAGLCFLAGMFWAAGSDIVTMKIRNDLVLCLLAFYALLAPLCGLGWMDIGQDAAVAIGVLSCMFILFGLGWIGGGDAKLAAVVALWMGAGHTGAFLLVTAVLGGALTIALIGFRSVPLPVQCLGISWIERLHARHTGVPYGVAIAVAGILTFMDTHWVRALT